LFIALTTGLATVALAQGTTSGANPSDSTAGAASATQGPAAAGPANSAGVILPVPPVQEPAVANSDGSQPGFFRPAPEAVVVPPFPPSTPGVAPPPVDTTTNATVGSSPSDRELRDSVATALAEDPKLHGARINVLVSGGAVTLSGTALDQEQADQARAVAERLAGSARVTANIAAGG
jgi:hypothetical protein